MFKNKNFLVGLLASLLLVVVYFLILSLVTSFSHAVDQFIQMWYWMLLLVVGFGLQVGLYSYIRSSLKQIASSTVSVATSGGVTTGSMVACCLHHLVDILPLIGLAGASIFLIKYQLLFIIIGVLSNLVGIIIMLEIIQKHNLAKGLLKELMIYNMNKTKKVVIALSLVIIIVVFIQLGRATSQKQVQETPKISEIVELSSEDNSQNNVTFTVTPIDFDLNSLARFEIKIETHSGSLDFDLTKVSILEDNEGSRYEPLSWDGSPVGGHHRSGIISFPKLNNEVKNIRLIIKDNPNLPSRIFDWKLE